MVLEPASLRPSVRTCVHIFKALFSETTWPIKEVGTNVYINKPGHMTKMAAISIHGKNP